MHNYTDHTITTTGNPFDNVVSDCFIYRLVDENNVHFQYATVEPSTGGNDATLTITIRVNSTSIEPLLDLIYIAAKEFKIEATSSATSIISSSLDPLLIAFRCASVNDMPLKLDGTSPV